MMPGDRAQPGVEPLTTPHALMRVGFALAGLYSILYSPILAVSNTGLVRPLVLVGLLVALFSSAGSGRLDIRVPSAVVVAACGLFAVLAFAQTLAFFGGSDPFLRSLILMVFTGVLPLAYLVIWAVPDDRPVVPFLARAAALLGTLQAVLILADFWSPSARALFASIFVQPELLDKGFRSAGLTSMTGDGLSVSQAICAVFAMYLSVSADRRAAMFGWGAALGLMLAAMVFVGRTGFVLVALFAVFLMLFDARRKRVFLGGLLVLAIFLGGIGLMYLAISDPRIENLFTAAVSSAFEAFIGLGQGDGLRTNTTDDLGTMIVFPDSLRGWLVGYGFYVNPANPDGNYMGTDIGYLRALFYVGIIGSAAIYAWYLWAGVTTYRMLRRMPDRILCAGLIVCFFVSQLKFPFLLVIAPMGFTLMMYFAAVRDRQSCT